VTCNIKVEFSSVLEMSRTCLPISPQAGESELFGVRKGSGEQNKQPLAGEFMATIIAILDFLFGCHHVHLSRVFTLEGLTYRVCCDCGAKFGYSLKTMSVERRLPLTPVMTRFRIA
jgi:hypothetical protein